MDKTNNLKHLLYLIRAKETPRETLITIADNLEKELLEKHKISEKEAWTSCPDNYSSYHDGIVSIIEDLLEIP